MIEPNQFLIGPEVTQLVFKARQIRESGKVFSDIVDAKGNYYVDLVQQGGGVLGIGLTGYTYILEQAGIRFYNLAGTSAGAINSLLMASLAEVGQPVSVKILNVLSRKNLFELVDGPKGIRKFIQRSIEKKTDLGWRLFWYGIPIYFLLKTHYGLNPGKSLNDWLVEELRKNNILSYKDLRQYRKKPKGLTHRLGNRKVIRDPRIAFIASEVTTHTRVELPGMAKLYWEDPDQACPVEFVRASMAVPYFYHPFVKDDIPDAGKRAGRRWKKFADYSGEIPKSVKFVDGGLLSNFPIDVFRVNGIPTRPTFGVRLTTFRKDYSDTSNFVKFSGAMISTMRQIHDYEVILRNPEYRQLICSIEADKNFNWLDFNMPIDRQKALFLLGAEKGLEFLEAFDWEKYKNIRSVLSNM